MFLGPWSKKTCGMIILAIALFIIVAIAFSSGFKEVIGGAGSDSGQADSRRMLEEGKQIFRHDTFGSEDFWGGELRLHEAIKGAGLGGVGPGVSPEKALSLGLKVDSQALPRSLARKIRDGRVDLQDPSTTVELLRRDAVVGVKGFFDKQGQLVSVGINCALCHSTVDNSLAPGLGRRLDGWANRDLNIGAIISIAPNLSPFAHLLQVDEETVRQVLLAWGPGKFDAQLILDGKAFRPDGKTAATLIPPAFGLAGVNLHTWTGFGSIPYWNAFVAVLEMHGRGTFFDERLRDPAQFPVAARAGLWNVRHEPDLVSSKLPALHAYQLSLAAPPPPEGSYDQEAARRGRNLFQGRAGCANCHVPPTFTEPGFNMHRPEEIGIDSFQADRSPEKRYRTAPLAGLWTHQKGGFYHDGRFKNLLEVVNHYNRVFRLNLREEEKRDLVEYLKSL
ncbi:MAG: hypothetical protein ACOX37_08700 [Bacillota bacterium]|jgi:mono/diheme cytochrome c family protein